MGNRPEKTYFGIFSEFSSQSDYYGNSYCILSSFLGATEESAATKRAGSFFSWFDWKGDFFSFSKLCFVFFKLENIFALILQWLNTKQTSVPVQNEEQMKTKRTKCYFMPNKNRDRGSKKWEDEIKSKPSTTIYCYLYDVCCP